MINPSPAGQFGDSADQPMPTTKHGTSIPLNLAQARQLLECYGGLEGNVLLSLSAAGHRGPGVYAWIEDHPEEGASFLDPDLDGTDTSAPASGDDRGMQIHHLQRALAYWMPSTSKPSHPYARQACEHAALLTGFNEQLPERAGDRLLEYVGRCNQANERMLDAAADAGCPEEMEAAEWIGSVGSELVQLREERDLLARELVAAHACSRELSADPGGPGHVDTPPSALTPHTGARPNQLVFHLSSLIAGWKTRQPLDARFAAAEHWMHKTGLIGTATLMSGTDNAPIVAANTPLPE
ncbi:hypothetical protein GR157_17035 [Burkholderia sp. 4701]|nr:hypothetical protein [Burkholderia sp. 4701]MXN83538.1 hypothetical protein [Burkholderia sp. 4812]